MAKPSESSAKAAPAPAVPTSTRRPQDRAPQGDRPHELVERVGLCAGARGWSRHDGVECGRETPAGAVDRDGESRCVTPRRRREAQGRQGRRREHRRAVGRGIKLRRLSGRSTRRRRRTRSSAPSLRCRPSRSRPARRSADSLRGAAARGQDCVWQTRASVHVRRQGRGHRRQLRPRLATGSGSGQRNDCHRQLDQSAIGSQDKKLPLSKSSRTLAMPRTSTCYRWATRETSAAYWAGYQEYRPWANRRGVRK